MDAVQVVQEDEYEFPYHYIPSRTRQGISTFVRWNWGLDYLVGLDMALHHLQEARPDSLVDIGCGDGRFVREVASRTPIRTILGVDYSDKAIALARALNPSASFQAIDVTRDELPQRFDAATLVEVVEHIPPSALGAFLQGVRRCLGDKGTLIVTVPHVNAPLAPKHYQHFTGPALEQALSETFRVERIVPFGAKPLLTRALARVLGLTGGPITVNSQRLAGIAYSRYLGSCLRGQDESRSTRLLAVARPR
jgi:2-polyprenyl-3-methyl-5-hydroxy-6-metoxy-1,4-benzoquinol methylase